MQLCYNDDGDERMNRKIYNDLLAWKKKKDKKPLMILGARQVGKTYIIDQFCKNEYEHYISINLFEDTKVVELYESSLNSDEKLVQLKVLLEFDFEKENTILFIDEIQESEKLISELKYFCEKHSNMQIICAGSLLGVRLKRFRASFPVGKVSMLTMYPMDFEEFLWAMNQQLLIDVIKNCYKNNIPLSAPVHEKALNLYQIYHITGGMPESIKNMVSVQNDIINYDTTILENIIDSYFKDMDKYVTSNSETLKIERVYRSIPSQLANESKKFQYSKIHQGAKARQYDTSLDWLEASNMILKSNLVSSPKIPLKGFVKEETFKLFLNDVGILNRLLEIKQQDILSDSLSLYKGAITENYVATQLKSSGYSLYYFKSNGKMKIDFLLYTKDGIIPVEVKAGEATQSKSLNIYQEKYHPNYCIRISRKNFGFDKRKNIKSVPLYAVFCIKEEIEKN